MSLKAAAACAPDVLDLAVALRLGLDVKQRLAAMHSKLGKHKWQLGDTSVKQPFATGHRELNLYGENIGAAGAATLAGTGAYDDLDGNGGEAAFKRPSYLEIAAEGGALFVICSGSVRRVECESIGLPALTEGLVKAFRDIID